MVRPVKPALSMISRLPRLGPPYFARSGTAGPDTHTAARRCAREHDGGTRSSAYLYRRPHSLTRHARTCCGHPRLQSRSTTDGVDGRDEPGHDEVDGSPHYRRMRIAFGRRGVQRQNAVQPEVASRAAMAGIALAKFADRPGEKNRRGSGKLRRGKLVDGHYSAPPASFSKPPGITPTDSVLSGLTAIHYYEK